MRGFKLLLVNTVSNSLVDMVWRLILWINYFAYLIYAYYFGAWDGMADSPFTASSLSFWEGFTANLRAINPKTHEARKMRLCICRLDINVCTYHAIPCHPIPYHTNPHTYYIHTVITYCNCLLTCSTYAPILYTVHAYCTYQYMTWHSCIRTYCT